MAFWCTVNTHTRTLVSTFIDDHSFAEWNEGVLVTTTCKYIFICHQLIVLNT